MQKRHYESELDIFKMRPTQNSQRFTDLVTFMSHVAPCFKEECPRFTSQMLELMENTAGTLHPDVRSKLLQALMLLRNREMLNPLLMLQLCFKLFSVQDKALRLLLSEYIINDIKTLNLHKTNDKLNRRVQALLFGIVAEDTTISARKSVYILSELYRRKVWTDARTVNVIASACASESTRVMVAGLKFFLGIESRMQDDDEEEEAKVGVAAKAKEINYHEHSKKTKARARSVKKQQEQVSKLRKAQEKKESSDGTGSVPLFPAILLIHDPHALAEKLFKRVRQSCERFEVKLLLMNMISRLVGCHQLLLLNFYRFVPPPSSPRCPHSASFLQRYLTSHQQSVTVILTYLLQACHALVPPEELTPVIRAIAFNFITERCSNEVIAVGINSVREIIQRVPAILREPNMDDFMADLAQYGKKTHKSVMIAAHSVINLVRSLPSCCPHLTLPLSL
jgi:protein SDA1